jgi:hypothetical protein
MGTKPLTREMMMKRLIVDFENNAERFWDSVREAAEAGNEQAQLLDDMAETIELDDDAADELLEYAATLPGWDGPEYADTPLIVQDC